MFPMKIFKLIFWFIIITFLTNCGNYLKRNEIKTKFDQTSNFIFVSYFFKLFPQLVKKAIAVNQKINLKIFIGNI